MNISTEELDLLHAYRDQFGRSWKRQMREDWETGRAGPTAQTLRNRLGPSWLTSFRLPERKKVAA